MEEFINGLLTRRRKIVWNKMGYLEQLELVEENEIPSIESLREGYESVSPFHQHRPLTNDIIKNFMLDRGKWGDLDNYLSRLKDIGLLVHPYSPTKHIAKPILDNSLLFLDISSKSSSNSQIHKSFFNKFSNLLDLLYP